MLMKFQVSFGCGEDFAFALTSSEKFYMWGDSAHGKITKLNPGGARYQVLPLELPDIQIRQPWLDDYAEKWREALRWIFLGQQDHESAFFGMPVEVAFHFVIATRRH
jgi:hypothetical protein